MACKEWDSPDYLNGVWRLFFAALNSHSLIWHQVLGGDYPEDFFGAGDAFGDFQ